MPLFPPDYSEARLRRYLAHWTRDPSQTSKIDYDAITIPTKAERKARQGNFDKIGQDYYDVVTPLYEQGWGQRFHFTPLFPGMTLDQSHEAYELEFSRIARLKPGMKVLDVGCGIGGPARDFARSSGAHITGVSNSAWHIERGNELSKEAGLADKVNLVLANFLHLPFEDGTFDAAYSIEALCYAPDPAEAIREIKRVLKPGAFFTIHDWAMTDKYHDKNIEHRKIRSWIEFGNGLTNMPTVAETRKGLKDAGFEILSEENMAYRSSPAPWWYAPAGHLGWAWKTPGWGSFWRVFTMSPFFLFFVRPIYYLMVLFGIRKVELLATLETMEYCCRSAADGGRMDIFTPMYMYACRKPGRVAEEK